MTGALRIPALTSPLDNLVYAVKDPLDYLHVIECIFQELPIGSKPVQKRNLERPDFMRGLVLSKMVLKVANLSIRPNRLKLFDDGNIIAAVEGVIERWNGKEFKKRAQPDYLTQYATLSKR